MRLDATEYKALMNALHSDGVAEGYLFGSRVDDNKRGGDIDVLVLSDRDAYELSRSIATKFFMECEEKIDVVVLNDKSLTDEQAAFLSLIRRGNLIRLV